MSVYKKVRAYIDSHGLKQVAVAQKAGIPTAAFNAILNGKRTMHADDLKAICLALEVTPETFIEFNFDRSPELSKGIAANSDLLIVG